MQKLILLTLIMILIVPIVSAICCEKNKDCTILETCQEGDCGICGITIYNKDGTVRIPFQNMTNITALTYSCNLSTNLSDYGNYPYSINCSSLDVCQGDCYVEIKADCGEKGKMEIAIMLGMLVLLGIFAGFTYYFFKAESGLAYFFFLGTFVFLTAITNLAWQIARDAGVIYIGVLLVLYRIMLIVTLMMFFIIATSLIVQAFRLRKQKKTAESIYKDNLV